MSMATLRRGALALCSLLPAGVLGAQVERLELNRGWQFRQVEPAGATQPEEWRGATVPGDVHLDLLAQHLIPDPFFGTNEAKLQWISDADWEYRSRVDLSAAMAASAHLDLVFEGLDTYAQVYLNDHLLLTADNQFRTWRVDAKPFAKPGENLLRVVFPAQDRAAEGIAKQDPWFGRNTVAAKSYIRKAAYEHGWDWGPTFVTSGIWKPAYFEAWETARLADFHMRQSDVSAATAHLSAEFHIVAGKEVEAELAVSQTVPGGSAAVRTASRMVRLHPGVNDIALPVEVDRPQLWYPAGYGAQPLYSYTATLTAKGAGHNAASSRGVRIGLRSLELRREPDTWGRSFEFVINGIPVFAKGADVIPSDSFANRVTREKYRAMLQSARDANMNMVRLWGGGYYESDDFYDLADELGIMIWHDFMFGNEWQPGTYAFEQSAEHEAEDQLRRLRNHPSIVIWCGNNETESAFHWKDRDKADPADRMRMWQDYLTLFHGVLARAVARFDPEVPYWPSSPSADLETTSPTYATGDEHIWDVWHGRVPFSTYETHHARFVTEYGFQSFPEMRTIESFTTPEDRTGILTDVMLAHQKNNEGNQLIETYLLKDYPKPKDFASFLYVSQVLQAEGIKIGAEHMRRERPRTMGSIFWQLNDCWPVASWSSIDSAGRWKALQFYARRFYSPILVSPHLEEGGISVYVVSDRTEAKTGTLKVEHLRFDGTVLATSTQQITITPLSSAVVMRRPMTELEGEARGELARSVVVATLTVPGESVSRNLTYLVPTREVSLPKATITASVAEAATGLTITLHSDGLARSVRLDSAAPDATLADNYFDLLPGETKTVQVTTALDAKTFRRSLEVRSLADAFAPTATAASIREAEVR